jgi:hypothetical protein
MPQLKAENILRLQWRDVNEDQASASFSIIK